MSSILGYCSAFKEPQLKSKPDPAEMNKRSRLGVGHAKHQVQPASVTHFIDFGSADLNNLVFGVETGLPVVEKQKHI